MFRLHFIFTTHLGLDWLHEVCSEPSHHQGLPRWKSRWSGDSWDCGVASDVTTERKSAASIPATQEAEAGMITSSGLAWGPSEDLSGSQNGKEGWGVWLSRSLPCMLEAYCITASTGNKTLTNNEDFNESNGLN